MPHIDCENISDNLISRQCSRLTLLLLLLLLLLLPLLLPLPLLSLPLPLPPPPAPLPPPYVPCYTNHVICFSLVVRPMSSIGFDGKLEPAFFQHVLIGRVEYQLFHDGMDEREPSNIRQTCSHDMGVEGSSLNPSNIMHTSTHGRFGKKARDKKMCASS